MSGEYRAAMQSHVQAPSQQARTHMDPPSTEHTASPLVWLHVHRLPMCDHHHCRHGHRYLRLTIRRRSSCLYEDVKVLLLGQATLGHSHHGPRQDP